MQRIDLFNLQFDFSIPLAKYHVLKQVFVMPELIGKAVYHNKVSTVHSQDLTQPKWEYSNTMKVFTPAI